MANALVESQRDLGHRANRARVTRGEHHAEMMNQKDADRMTGARPRQNPLNQGSLGRNGKRGMTV